MVQQHSREATRSSQPNTRYHNYHNEDTRHGDGEERNRHIFTRLTAAIGGPRVCWSRNILHYPHYGPDHQHADRSTHARTPRCSSTFSTSGYDLLQGFTLRARRYKSSSTPHASATRLQYYSKGPPQRNCILPTLFTKKARCSITAARCSTLRRITSAWQHHTLHSAARQRALSRLCFYTTTQRSVPCEMNALSMFDEYYFSKFVHYIPSW